MPAASTIGEELRDEPLVDAGRRVAAIVAALRDVVPDAVHGAFRLADAPLDEAPPAARELLAPYASWWAFVFAVPIREDGLWIWHHHGRHRSLLANYVIAKAARAIASRLERAGERAVDVWALSHEEPGIEADLERQPPERRISMTRLGELAGLGTRGLNNLLLHPELGSWLQIHALLVERPLPTTPPLAADVCTHCGLCVDACPADALAGEQLAAARCGRLVAAPWEARSGAVALTEHAYVECRACIESCPIGERPEGIFAWRR